jgi:hypothetical protein
VTQHYAIPKKHFENPCQCELNHRKLGLVSSEGQGHSTNLARVIPMREVRKGGGKDGGKIGKITE